MKKYLPILLIVAGCSSTGQENSRLAYEQFIKGNVEHSKQRTFMPIKMIAGAGESISISGIAEIQMEAPLAEREVLSAMPRSDSGFQFM